MLLKILSSGNKICIYKIKKFKQITKKTIFRAYSLHHREDHMKKSLYVCMFVSRSKVKIKSQSTEDLSNIFALWQSSNHILRWWKFSQSHVFAIYLPSNQILWHWEFSQSCVSSMGIQQLGFHESGNWENQAFPRSSSRPIRFGKGEKSESTGHFSKFVIIGITLGKDCLNKMPIVYKAWPKVSEGRQSKSTNHLSTFIKFQEVLLEEKADRIR